MGLEERVLEAPRRFLDDVLYTKEAIGQFGVPFTQYKLRTMYSGADRDLELAVANGLDEIGKPKNDPRVTPTGKTLRKYGIDELPQIYNILRGEMSLVGVRPFSVQDSRFIPEDIVRESIRFKPGFLSAAYAGKDRSYEGSYATLRKYLAEKSQTPFWTDLKYAVRVIYNILFKGYRSR
jgi:lipopolysaccharide/colanic/teichoic acid biosynthesis glycosyltransferase